MDLDKTWNKESPKNMGLDILLVLGSGMKLGTKSPLLKKYGTLRFSHFWTGEQKLEQRTPHPKKCNFWTLSFWTRDQRPPPPQKCMTAPQTPTHPTNVWDLSLLPFEPQCHPLCRDYGYVWLFWTLLKRTHTARNQNFNLCKRLGIMSTHMFLPMILHIKTKSCFCATKPCALPVKQIWMD